MDYGVAVCCKIEYAYFVVTVENHGVALCGVDSLHVKHTHIHTNSADDVSESSPSAVGCVDRNAVACGVAENSVRVADSDCCGCDLAFDLVCASVSELLAGSQTADASNFGAELEGGSQTEIDSGRGTESEY